MIIEIEFPITTTGKPAKATKSKTVVFRDAVRFDIPDYGPSAKRPAMLVDGPPGFQPTPYYGIEGKLYGQTFQKVPSDRRSPLVVSLSPRDNVLTSHLENALVELGKTLRNHHSTAVASALYPKELADYFADGLTTTRAANRADLAPILLPTFERLSVQDLDMAEIERQRAAFAAHLSEFVIVDGEFMRSMPEPVYGVTIGYPAHEGGGRPHLASEGSAAKVELILPPRGQQLHRMQQHVNMVAFFSADRHGDALAYANAIKPHQGPGPADASAAHRRIRVRDASYVKFDDEAASLLMISENMARNFLRETLGYQNSHSTERIRGAFEGAPIEAIVAWKTLTAAISAEEQDDLPVAIRNCLEVQQATGTGYFAGYAMPPAVIEMALAKWENREVSLAFQSPGQPAVGF
ncbi:hypothetical protein HFO56_33780 [Rhizobium laguerreae]|uniref:hypothetical protein n=1 Tax=Rhizobium laguerreae TaxID=1076926 RepID=UPI001C925581|nr:hypothetical protein [Rhizobium laguerreae]MBY3157298.1 hypothetical protein [Rhizobium laguerreae]